MSAAEPADPRRDAPVQGAGTVIHLSEHLAAQRHRPEPATGAHQEPSPEQQLTEHMEALFNAHEWGGHQRTLSDPATAQAFTIALEAVLMMLDGALVEGIVEEEQHRRLRLMVEGMQRAPENL